MSITFSHKVKTIYSRIQFICICAIHHVLWGLLGGCLMTIGQKIKELRKQLDMSVDDLASKLGKNRATIYRYERGDIENLPLDVLEPLANALETTPGYLMGWEDSPKKKELSTIDDVTMGDVFKALRIGSNLSIEEFSHEIGLSAEDINNYEVGKTPIPVNIINLVADFFGISIAELIKAHRKDNDRTPSGFEMKKERFERFKVWNKEFGQIHFTDDEINKIMEYTRFLLSQRRQ